jgi:hypothetical protein
VLPLAALVYMLFEGFTPLYAGSMGLALTVALILGASITLGFSNTALRYVFWIGLALVVAAVSRNGLEIVPVAGVVRPADPDRLHLAWRPRHARCLPRLAC